MKRSRRANATRRKHPNRTGSPFVPSSTQSTPQSANPMVRPDLQVRVRRVENAVQKDTQVKPTVSSAVPAVKPQGPKQSANRAPRPGPRRSQTAAVSPKTNQTPAAPPKPTRNLRNRLAVIIPAMNEAKSIGGVLNQVQLLQPTEVVVVVNGSTDNTSNVARSFGATVMEYSSALGNDVGRAVGILHTDADVYLVLDGDFAVEAEALVKLVRAVDSGTDVAMNSLKWLEKYPTPDTPSLDRYFLNMMASRPDLGLENLLTIPHALSRRAVDVIGVSTFANPLLATAVAIDRGLSIACPTAIDVLSRNRRRPNHLRRPGEQMSSAFARMHGDTVEAISYLLNRGQSSGTRRAQPVPTHKPALRESAVTGTAVSVILSVSNWKDSVLHLIQGLKAQQAEVVVVTSDSQTDKRLASENVDQVVVHPGLVRYELAFALGAKDVGGAYVVFHDTSIPITAPQLLSFAQEGKARKVDILLNNQTPYKKSLRDSRSVHLGNRFVNVTAGKMPLQSSGLTVPPFAMSRRAIDTLSPSVLVHLSLAQVLAVRAGLSIELGPSLDTLTVCDRQFRAEAFSDEHMLQEFSRALWYWTQVYGRRGGFTDENRQRKILPAIPGRYETTGV